MDFYRRICCCAWELQGSSITSWKIRGIHALLTFFLRQQKIITVVAPEDNSDFVVLKSSSPVAASIIALDEEEIAMTEATPNEEESA